MWGQLHHCDGLFQKRQWHKHIDDLFDETVWDTLLAQERRCCGMAVRDLQETNVSFVCEQSSSLMWSMSHNTQRGSLACSEFRNASCLDFDCRRSLLLVLGPSRSRCTSSCSPRAVFCGVLMVDSRRRFATGTSTVVSMYWSSGTSTFHCAFSVTSTCRCITTGRSAVFCSRSSLVAAKVFRSSKGIAAIFSC